MILYLDVDGVLIPGPDDQGDPPPTHDIHHVTPTGYDKPIKVWLNPHHGPQLAALVADTGLTPVWCTSWRQDASRLIAPCLGLPDWPHVSLPRLPLTTSHPNGYLWKRDHLIQHAAGAPFVWIDDDFTSADHEWAAARVAGGQPTLLVQPQHRVGIQPQDLWTVRTWVSTHRSDGWRQQAEH
ncbi:HAD domain-containing protein [Streptomyces sp. NBRC 109706]|uniref:HAD domain-containing protein n=1 Tax=Streptomyces sp. NBRC 109706 TaxID=1550035 RepID=UPI000783DBCC|nr:HAD domain-containing protein [Streptomyces sp. NBRC 109706]